MSYYDTEVTARAVKALWRWTQRNGYLWQQPDRYLSKTAVDKDGRTVVELNNVNGLLARYVEQPSGRLTRSPL